LWPESTIGSLEERHYVDSRLAAGLAELLHNYEEALQVFGKGSESASGNEAAQPEKTRPANDHRCFAQPGEAEWGC
jgi:hypothetical protein